MALGQFLCDAGLARQEPIHGGIQVVFIGGRHPQFFSQGGRMPQPGGAQFRTRMEQPLGDHGEHELPFPTGLGRQEDIEAELPHGADHGFHRAMRERVLYHEEAVQGNERHILPQ